MKTTKLLALLIVTVLALSACTKTALRKDLLEYMIFHDTIQRAEDDVYEQMQKMLLGILTPFEHHKDILLDMTTDVTDGWRALEVKTERVQAVLEMRIQYWVLLYDAFEKLDETMLVATRRTIEDVTSDDLEGTWDKVNLLANSDIIAHEEEYGEEMFILYEETNFTNYRKWKKYKGDVPLWEYAD